MLFDPMRLLTGRLPLRVQGVLVTSRGTGRFSLESASIAGVPVPKSVLQTLVYPLLAEPRQAGRRRPRRSVRAARGDPRDPRRAGPRHRRAMSRAAALSRPLASLKGVGDCRAADPASAGLQTVEDLPSVFRSATKIAGIRVRWPRSRPDASPRRSAPSSRRRSRDAAARVQRLRDGAARSIGHGAGGVVQPALPEGRAARRADRRALRQGGAGRRRPAVRQPAVRDPRRGRGARGRLARRARAEDGARPDAAGRRRASATTRRSTTCPTPRSTSASSRSTSASAR